MFRASPWITYEPSELSRTEGGASEPSNVNLDMDQDVDMDAPQISTLPEEETPPPQPTRTSKFRVKLLVNDAKGGASPPASLSRTPAAGQGEDEGEGDDEDEEDQLIDDDDMNANRPLKRKPSKRKTKKVDKRIAGDEKRSLMQVGADSHIDQEIPPADVLDAGRLPEDDSIVHLEPLHPKLPLKKKPLPRKSSQRKGKGVLLAHKDSMPSFEDGGNFSETYTGTAASSPITFYPEGTPELDPANLPSTSSVLVEDTKLDHIPLPVYPLPTKPFPVQPPPKITSGFAPMIPLDKSGLKVRHWRTASREIRGIAGGRWFARSWVGEKESEYASANAAGSTSTKTSAAADGVALPKLPSVSISGPSAGRKKAKLPKSRVVSAAASRSSSVVTDIPSTSHSTRTPTKMRTIVAAPASEGGNDSDLVVPVT